jgi:5'-3' exoribonuclease 1
MTRRYLEGLQFVLLYYYQGIPSWSWYYDNYYSPLVSDIYEYLRMENLNEGMKIEFVKDQPYCPI